MSFSAVLAATASVLALNSAHAQAADQRPAADGQAADASQPAGLQEVVVTAQRSEATLQRTPVSVVAVSSDALTARGITDVTDLPALVPGLRFQSIGPVIATIRGIGTFSLQPGVDSSVAYNLDGVSLPHPTSLIPIAFDLARVEVLRGPQGTLFGRNTNAGAINQVTNRPRNSFEAKGQVGFGNYNLVSTEAMVNVPVSSKLAMRAAFASSKHSGYYQNGFSDADIMAGRISLLYQFNDKVDVQVNADTSFTNGLGWSASACPPNTNITQFPGCAGVPWKPFDGLAGQPNTDLLKMRNSGAYAQFHADLGFGTLVYIPSYRYTYFTELNTSGNPTNRYFPKEKNGYHTEELRIDSPSASPIKWVAGLFYSNETLRTHTTTFNNNPASPLFIISVLDLGPYKSRSLAAFAQATVPITEQFRIQAGGRYTDERKSVSGTAGNYCVNLPTNITDPTCPIAPAPAVLRTIPIASNSKLDKFTWRLGAEFDVLPRSMLYANVSTGFKSGGVNSTPAGLVNGVSPTFGPETITAYQAGVKNRFFDNRLQINAEAYYYDYHGYQTLFSRVVPPGVLLIQNVNAQKSRFKGLEIEASFLVTRADKIDLSVSVVDAKHIEYVIPATGVNRSGFKVPNAQPLVLTGTYQKTIDLANGGQIIPLVSGTYSKGYYVEGSNNPAGFQDSYFQADASIRYQPANNRWSVNAWIRNIGNTDVLWQAIVATLPTRQTYGATLAPRTYGLTFTANID
jgi:iron complex outermembrane receptor protein